jgi:cell wall-associated NlpC family hydrolase
MVEPKQGTVKLLLLILGLGVTALLGLPLLVVAVVATHPWLAAGTLSAPVGVRDDRAAAAARDVAGLQWPSMVSASQASTCGVTAEDLAAVAHIAGDAPVETLPTMVQRLCALGYGSDRVHALNAFGGCQVALCLGTTDFATAVTRQAAVLRSGQGVVETAQQWLGVPYVFGGCSKSGVDCSCFVQLVYRALGVSLPRVASDQWNAVRHIATSELQPGDLVFFHDTYMPGISHVGIFVGGGRQINAPTEGQFVSVQPVFDGYWGAHFAGAGRVQG